MRADGTLGHYPAAERFFHLLASTPDEGPHHLNQHFALFPVLPAVMDGHRSVWNIPLHLENVLKGASSLVHQQTAFV